MVFSGINPLNINWDSVNLPTTWKKIKINIKLIFSGPLKESEVERTFRLARNARTLISHL
jgi:hypothetical protein